MKTAPQYPLPRENWLCDGNEVPIYEGDLVADRKGLHSLREAIDKALTSQDGIASIEDLNSQENVPETSKEGILLVYNKLMNFLTQKGIKPINAKGEMFDENHHEAVSQFPAENENQKGLVIEELLKGYTMFDKVIRFSKVVVAI